MSLFYSPQDVGVYLRITTNKTIVTTQLSSFLPVLYAVRPSKAGSTLVPSLMLLRRPILEVQYNNNFIRVLNLYVRPYSSLCVWRVRLTKSNDLRQVILYPEMLQVLELYNNTKNAHGTILTDITKSRRKDAVSKL